MKMVYKDEMIILGKKTKIIFLDEESYKKNERTLPDTTGTANSKDFIIWVML